MRISDWSSDVCSSDLQFVVKRWRFQRSAKPRGSSRVILMDDHHLRALVAEQIFQLAILLRLKARGAAQEAAKGQEVVRGQRREHFPAMDHVALDRGDPVEPLAGQVEPVRSVGHTSELQSPMRNTYTVFGGKKKKTL